MANGAFLGGFAEGFGSAQTRALAERAQTEQTEIARGQLGIAGRAQSLREQAQRHQESQDFLKRGDAAYNDLVSAISESVKQMRAVGQPTEKILAAVEPMVRNAELIGPRIGRPRGTVSNGVKALIAATPTSEQSGAAVGAGKAASTIAETTTLNKAVGKEGGIRPEQLPLSEVELKKIEIVNKMADDYFKESKTFNTVSDYYDRIKLSSNNPAGHIGLIFSYIKMLDPTSTVSPGEQATAKNTASVPERVRMIYNRMLGDYTFKDGQWVQKKDNVEFILTTEQAQQFKDQAKIYFDNARRNQDKVDAHFVERALRARANPAHVVPGYKGPTGFQSRFDEPMTTPSGLKFKVSQ